MGMAASQARLLSITARLTDNENSGQSVSYSKQRLADQTQQITDEYNEALDSTKLTVLTGFDGSTANYEDISYNLMTGMQMAENTKQYVVTDTKGRVLVTNEIANAYEKSRGNYNVFLETLGYSQADITVQKTYTDTANRTSEEEDTEQQIHEAWDKYFATVGINLGDDEHDFGFGWVETMGFDSTNSKSLTTEYNIGDGYATYTDEDGVTQPINYEGASEESRNLYDYAMSITEAYLRTNAGKTSDETKFNTEYDMSSLKSAANTDNASAIKYYQNIFNKIQSSGYFTYTSTPSEIDSNHLYTSEGTGTAGTVKKNPLQDNYTFEAALRDGTLRIEYYSSTDKEFVSTTISEDNCIQEVTDERAVAKAEAKYTQDMADLENQDNKLDLELNKLDTEHSALQTEYDSVKNVLDKNVESSFKVFS
jgi:hypothetical protein